jgi:FkbM family methyltransferase
MNVPVEVLLFDEMVDKNIVSMLENFKPDIIGISVVTPTFPRVKSLCNEIREITKAPIVAGGHHITAVPESIVESSIDVGVLGEGEATFLELVQCFLQTGSVRNPHIQGIVYAEEKRFVRTSPRPLIRNLDSIPPPDRALFNMTYYSRPKRIAHGLYGKATSMMPSRGCPFGTCNFCSSYLTWGNVARFFPPDYVADEIENIANEYALNFVIFLDDNFTTKVKWLEGLSLLLKERGLDKRICFDCESISTYMDEKKALILKEMGCVRIEFGFESGSTRILNKLKAGRVSLQQNERAIDICKRHNISILGNVIFGYIDETPHEFDESVAWFRSHSIDYVAAHVYTPYPGTPGWKECIEKGIIDSMNVRWEQFATGSAKENLIVNTVFPVGELMKRVREVGVEFALRNQVLVVDSGLSLVEKARLYATIVQEKDAPLRRRPNNSMPKIWLFGAQAALGFPSLISLLAKVSRCLHPIRIKGIVWSLRNRLMPPFPLLCRLSFGAWWLAWNDVIGSHLYFRTSFEEGERKFLLRFLQRRMTVFDIGAHSGLYTLLASERVGIKGQVLAFEPSPRELRRLRWNLFLNRCRNVRVEPIALSSGEGIAELYVCLGRETGCNSLRRPAVSEPVGKVQVSVTTVDRYVERTGINKVDFMKLDVEGAELDVLRGASRLLSDFKPIILCELADIRTEPWGYRSVEIYEFLTTLGYQWFSITREGRLRACPKRERFHENLLAVPEERLGLVAAAGEELGE